MSFNKWFLNSGPLFKSVLSAAEYSFNPAGIGKKYFGELPSGERIYSYTLSNKNGMSATIINFGATVVKLYVPDDKGRISDIILGYDSLSGYAEGNAYIGAIVGRYGNRIKSGQFSLNGKNYQISINDGKNSLHGGKTGFDKRIWTADILKEDSEHALRLTYTSPDGEEGFPGEVKTTVIYSLTGENELKIEYSATTDKPTIVNPTNHCYFNLTGSPENTILNHFVKINADKFTPVDSEFIPTGEIRNAAGTPMDFKNFTVIGSRINEDDIQLKNGRGYDHNWVLNNYDGTVHEAAAVYDPLSGRLMRVFTDQPGIQFYSGNFLDGSIKGKNGIYYKYRTGLCLETQHFPDSPNHADFPKTELMPGESYKQTTIYGFSIKNNDIS